MAYLALSVLSSSLIFVIFKLFGTYKINTLIAIISNYFIACTVGAFLYSGAIQIAEIPQKPWFFGTLALGFLFIVIFNLIAATAQKVGVSVASVATKMSLVIPVIFGILMYQEKLSGLKIIGIGLALAAVYFTSIKTRQTNLLKSSLLLPFLVFLGSGIIDTSIKYIQEVFIEEEEYPLFSATVFAAAAVTGMLFILLKSIKQPERIQTRDLIGGIALGVPNYFSIYFLLKALQNEDLNSASVFTINNVGIVLFSTLLGIILFKEKISSKNWFGVALAIISIFLVVFF